MIQYDVIIIWKINDAVIALVGNKIDFFEASAKDGTNVIDFFNTLIQRIYERQHNIEDESKILNENNIKLTNNRRSKKGCLH